MQIKRMEKIESIVADTSVSVLQQTRDDKALATLILQWHPALLNIEKLKPLIQGSPSDEVLCLACEKVHSQHVGCQQ